MNLTTTDQPAARPELEDEDGLDLYAVLRVERDAGAEAIHRAYRLRARVCHPDMPKGSPEAWAQVELAYAVLSDPERRKIYDETGNYEASEPDNQLAEALAALARMLQALGEMGGLQLSSMSGKLGPPQFNVDHNDLWAKLVDLLRGKAAQLDVQRSILESRLEATRVMRLRFEQREPDAAADYIGILLDREMETLKQDMRDTIAMAAPIPKALEIARTYRYRFDQRQEGPRVYGGDRDAVRINVEPEGVAGRDAEVEQIVARQRARRRDGAVPETPDGA